MNNNDFTSPLPFATEADFEVMYKTYFRELHAYAYTLLKDWDVAEEIVQDMFYNLWEKNEVLQIRISLKSYLYRSIYHGCLNYSRRQKIHLRYEASRSYIPQDYVQDAAQKVNLSEIELLLQKALNKLPEKCRAIFQLNRFDDLKYKEIAEHLNISIKTVETHMGKALKIIRKEMKEFLPVLAYMLIKIFRS